MNATLTVDDGGKITLPDAVRDGYQLRPDTLVRIIETRDGNSLVPLIGEPMSHELQRELEEWQALGAATLEPLLQSMAKEVSFSA
jgi:bifunctional DNA-binding transcriptional regulator/antitoxin component of YhaV-PrlF toxin-antitoxin module